MTKIIGNTTSTPNPRPDWNQTDETKADYIKNKPAIPNVDQNYSAKSVNAQSGIAVSEAIASMVDSAPETLNTLNELAEALGDDPNFATTVATQIGNKVDKVDGKGLSTEDYTTSEKNKLVGIEVGAQKNIQSDWNQIDETKADYIKNKPKIIKVTNIVTSDCINNITYADYPYRYDFQILGVTESMIAEVIFDVTEATSGNFAPICQTYEGGVSVYGKVEITSLTIPLIFAWEV